MLGKYPRQRHIAPTQDDSYQKHKREKDGGVGVEPESIGIVVDPIAIESFEGVVSIQRDPGDGDEAEEDDEEL